MKFLFFDIECANCFGGKAKIYSFGYLVTDEKFNILTAPQDLLINPDSKFDPYVKKNILVYDRAYLKTMPKFDERYPFIKKLMTEKGVVCVGYGIDNDIRFLSDDCKRYGLDQIKPKLFDVQKLILLAESKPARKLDIEFHERFAEGEGVAHRSDVDAIRTMMIAKQICERSGVSLIDYSKMKLPVVDKKIKNDKKTVNQPIDGDN